MDLTSLVSMLLLVMSPDGANGFAAGARQALPEPIATRQSLFSIPFQVEPQRPGEEPVEVQLHVSVDNGATWHLYSKVKPERGYFLFRAGGDGEFWFLIRTLDSAGQLSPEPTRTPGLRVVVDTTPPKLDLDASRGDSGRVIAKWQVNDPNFDPSSLKVQYRTAENPIWQYVAVDRDAIQTDGATRRGEVSWWLQGNAARVEVRAEAADTADNPTVTHAQIAERTLPPAVSVPTSPYEPATTEPESPSDKVAQSSPQADWRPSTEADSIRTQQPISGVDRSGRQSAATRPKYTFPTNSYPASPSPYAYATATDPHAETGSQAVATHSPLRSHTAQENGQFKPVGERYAETTPQEEPAAETAWDRAGDRYASRPTSDAGAAPAHSEPLAGTAPRNAYSDSYESSEAYPATSEPVVAMKEPGGGSVAIQIHPAIRNQYTPADTPKPIFDMSLVPAGVSVRMVNSLVFELAYDVESVGPSGIARVEVWGTRDGGHTWTSYGVDEDKQSPLLVTVQEEGLYGFRVAVKNGAGLGGRKPKMGDKPDLWIGVDQTKPSARILGAEQSGDGTSHLKICWKADDPLLGDSPISLYFSETAGGPWKPIAEGLDNTGEYAWAPSGPASERVFLRLEVQDKAGNLGISETSTAVALDGIQPVVRIRDVRPLDHAAQTPPKRYSYR